MSSRRRARNCQVGAGLGCYPVGRFIRLAVLFGFDFYLSDSIYLDTENYIQPVKDEVVNRMPKHTQEIGNLCAYYQECNFTFVNDEHELPEVIAINKNVKSIKYNDLDFA